MRAMGMRWTQSGIREDDPIGDTSDLKLEESYFFKIKLEMTRQDIGTGQKPNLTSPRCHSAWSASETTPKKI